MAKKPNIIIFNPDEMRFDAMGHMKNPAAVTPFLDEFAQTDAVSFSNAYCQNPVCVPSRCSFMTGLYPHTNGHRTMSYLLRPGEETLLKELKDNGYYVWMNDRNDLTAGQIDGWTESHADEIHYFEGKRAPGAKEPSKKTKGEKGFYSHFLGELGVDEKGLNYTADDDAVDAAIERLRNPVNDKPICVFLGLFYPHVPYGVEEPYFSVVDRTKLPKRIDLSECKDKAPILTAINKYQDLKYEERDYDELRAVYLGMCSKVDAQFRRLCNALKEVGLYEDTAIFFFSDHGDFCGDYSLVEKSQNTFEDCLVRVPFLIKPPKGYDLDAGVSDSLCELVDFYATALDFAGIESTHTHFGKSLVSILADKKQTVRDFVCSEGGREKGEIHCDEYHQSGPNGANENDDYWPKKMAQADDDLHDKGIMIRDNRFKYISRSRTKDEFYDLKSDQYEKINEIDNPSYQDDISAMKGKLLKWLQQTADIVPYEIDSRFTKKMMWSKVGGMVPEDQKENVLKMIDEGITFSALLSHCISLLHRG